MYFAYKGLIIVGIEGFLQSRAPPLSRVLLTEGDGSGSFGVMP